MSSGQSKTAGMKMKVLPRDAGVLAMGKLEKDTDAEEDFPLWWLGLWCV